VRVAWVHPTWRDLVIERLAGDADLRCRFLSRCGPHGVVLALSTGGGAQGERALPLIGGDGDWDALGDRIYALLPELDHAELVMVLRAILSAAQIVTPDWMAAGEARVLARMALERTAALWAAAGAPVLLDCVDAWLSLSDHLDPPVSPDFLGPTWAELRPADLPNHDDLAEVQRFTDWVTLCELLGEFSHELLAQLGFGQDHEALIVRYRAHQWPGREVLMPSGPVSDPTTPWEDVRRREIADSTVLRVLADL
jgi:hypothetical protein